MNIIETHKKQLNKFKNLQERLPCLQKELEKYQFILKEQRDAILEQRKAAAVFLMLDKKKKRTKEEEEEYQNAKKIKNEKSKIYAEISKTEDAISTLERRIKAIASKQEEIEFIEKTAFILKEYDEIENAQRSGMPQNSVQLPLNIQHTYTRPISNSIQCIFVTKSRRSIFNTNHSLEPHFTAKNVKDLYCFLLKSFSHTSYDNTIDEILAKKGKIYLTEYNLPFPENQSLNNVIQYYKIPLKDKLEVYVEYPDENDTYATTTTQPQKTRILTRKDLFNEYKEIIGLASRSIERVNESSQVCSNCQNDNGLIEDTHMAQLICGNCGFVMRMNMTAKGFKGIPYNEEKQACIRKSEYKPIMHLRDIIKQTQAIESFIVPDEILEMVDIEREKNKKKPEQLTVDLCRNWLKKLSTMDVEKKYCFPKYYKYIHQIILKLGGPPPVRYTYQDEQAIEYWFNRLEKAFNVFAPLYGPNKRSNLFSYNYLMRRICIFIAFYQRDEKEQNWWLEHAKTWPLLKDDQKLFTYEFTMRKMCQAMNEPFFSLSSLS